MCKPSISAPWISLNYLEVKKLSSSPGEQCLAFCIFLRYPPISIHLLQTSQRGSNVPTRKHGGRGHVTLAFVWPSVHLTYISEHFSLVHPGTLWAQKGFPLKRPSPGLNLIQSRSHLELQHPRHMFDLIRGGVPSTPELLGQIHGWKRLMQGGLCRPAKLFFHLGGRFWCGKPQWPEQEVEETRRQSSRYHYLSQCWLFLSIIWFAWCHIIHTYWRRQHNKHKEHICKHMQSTKYYKLKNWKHPKTRVGHFLHLTLLLTPFKSSIEGGSILFGHSALETVQSPWQEFGLNRT